MLVEALAKGGLYPFGGIVNPPYRVARVVANVIHVRQSAVMGLEKTQAIHCGKIARTAIRAIDTSPKSKFLIQPFPVILHK
jgi:hypothetical protein